MILILKEKVEKAYVTGEHLEGLLCVILKYLLQKQK